MVQPVKDNAFNSPRSKSRSASHAVDHSSLVTWDIACAFMGSVLAIMVAIQLLHYLAFGDLLLTAYATNWPESDARQHTKVFYLELVTLWIPAIVYFFGIGLVGCAVLSHSRKPDRFPKFWPLAIVLLAVIGIIQTLYFLAQFLGGT